MPAGKEHRAAGHAHRAVMRAHDIGVGKSDALGHETIHVGRDYLVIPQGVDGVEPLIIREQDEDVWLLRRTWCNLC